MSLPGFVATHSLKMPNSSYCNDGRHSSSSSERAYPQLAINWDNAKRAAFCALVVGVPTVAGSIAGPGGGALGFAAGVSAAADFGCMNPEGPFHMR
jgi:hypothetical protein